MVVADVTVMNHGESGWEVAKPYYILSFNMNLLKKIQFQK